FELLRSSRDVRRIVLLGHAGHLTLDALRWMTDVGIGFCHIDKDGRLIATSVPAGKRDARLRLAQALAPFNGSALPIGITLIDQKFQAQARTLASSGLGDGFDLEAFRGRLTAIRNVEQLRSLEAKVALDYWRRLAPIEIRFERDARIPDEWRTLGERG